MAGQTLAAPAEHLLEVRKSRFLARAAPSADPGAAQAWLQQAADPAATHNCWAWRCGQHYRSSDDGEPGGTAGRPILAAIDAQGLDQVAVLVVRWYGGIKLGAGGLARAYGGAAAECLRLATRRELVDLVEAEIACDFALAGVVHGLADGLGLERTGESFDAGGLRLRLRLPASTYGELQQRLRDASRGAARLRRLEPGPP